MVFMSNQSAATAGANTSDNQSIAEFISQQTQAAESKTEEIANEENEAVESEEEIDDSIESEEDATEEQSEEESEEEEQEFDIESLSPEQIQLLAKKGKSRLLQRIGELTAKNKAYEEKISAQAEAKPLAPAIPESENPFRDLKTVEEVQAKRKELQKVAKDLERTLDDHEDYGPEDVIQIGDKEYTKKQLKGARRNAVDALAEFLPAQEAQIARSEYFKKRAEEVTASIPIQLPAMADPESEIAKAHKNWLADPIAQEVLSREDEFSAVLPLLMAHALNSMASGQKRGVTKPAAAATPKPKVAGSPFGAGAASSSNKPAAKRVQELQATYEQTGRTEDYIALTLAKQK